MFPHSIMWGRSYLLRNCASLMLYFVITSELCGFVLFVQCFPFCVRMTCTEKESTNKPRKCYLTQLKPVTQVKWEAELNNVTCHTSQLPKNITAYDFHCCTMHVALVILTFICLKGYFIIVWRCAPSRQIVTSELVPLLLALTLEHVT
jgi:hypothetical protein